ncbi:hypothetical protein QN277_005931 [Acacia crassicarpa]|uniref:Uncharacterized protein n=1 Tax=Acacia crassicarpa TaxID=499986 RepID=A0AAE1J069_9FABA|nr:hypothetical protein QN277_005931 [Acacia crassicarpa]
MYVILEGLPEEYDVTVKIITTQKHEVSVSEIESLLLAQEIRIEKSLIAASIDDISINLVAKSEASSAYSTNAQSHSKTQNTHTSMNPVYQDQSSFDPNRGQQFRGKNTSGGRYRGRGSRSNLYSTHCCRSGRTYSHCYSRPDFQSYHASHAVVRPYSYTPAYPAVLVAHSPATNPYMLSVINPSPTRDYYYDYSWFPHCGASHHVTPHQYNISQADPMTNQSNQVFVGDNNANLDFHPSWCCIKSQVTHVILLKGNLRNDGLYYFRDLRPLLLQSTCASVSAPSHMQPSHVLLTHSKDASSYTKSPCSQSSKSTPTMCTLDVLAMWHCRLGYASMPCKGTCHRL